MTVAIGRQGRAPELLIWADGSLHEGTWTIAGKRHRTLSEEADDDDLLEGGELFDLVLVPAAAFFPGDMLSVSVYVSGRNALSCSRTVPAGITPVMNLG
ncbi:MAG: hypothetical protein GKC04_07470 [Methanomicrobiales archaeon]|nr:hypothetical protein [Methanomicrobiales archaeon]